MITCAVFNPVLDVIYTSEEFETGKTYTNVDSTIEPAGKGVNVAKTVKALGEDVCVVALLPETDRTRFSRFFDKQGIRAKYLCYPGTTRINVTLCESSSDRVSHICSTGIKIPQSVQNDFIKYIEHHIKKNDRWALCGSLPVGFDSNAYGGVIKRLKKRGAFTLLDTREDALKMGIQAKPNIITPNLDELQDFFGEEVRGIRHIALKGKKFLDMGIEYVFITLGSDGMIAIHENDCILCSIPPVKSIDTVGCGDAAVAGVLVGIQKKMSFEEICRLAVASGVSNSLHYGAGNVEKTEVDRISKDICIESV